MQNHTTIIGVLDLRAMGCTYDDCRAKYGIGNSTVRLIESRHKKTGIPLETLKGMDPSEVVALFFPNKGPSKEKPMPDYQKIYDRIHEKDSKANLFFLWMEYKGQHANGYQYTQFAEHYKRFVAERYPTKALSMAVERIPGEKVYIDWAGDTPKLVLDVRTGQLLAVHLFVTTVGVSGLIYAEAFPNERIPSFCDGTSHAMEYYGATPRFFVPDNCKTAVTKHTKDRLVINAAYRDLESFYGVVVLPPPPRKPKGKPTVEKAVQYAETWILERLRERAPYAGYAAINDEIEKIVDELNGSTPRGWTLTRREAFEQCDRPAMKRLADGAFSRCDYAAFAKVPNNYHVEYDGHYYSVSYTYYGHPVILKATASRVTICDESNRVIASHQRSYVSFPKYVTEDSHMPPSHRYYHEVNSRDGDYYRRWAAAIGDEMLAFIERLIASFDHEEQAYNSCNGALHLCDGAPKELANAAAKACLDASACKFSYFKRALSEASERGPADAGLPDHGNIWGGDYYK